MQPNIHPTAVIYGREHITFGRNVRIDAFTVITACAQGMHFGDCVHIGAASVILGSSDRVSFGTGSGLSPRVTVFTATDDFTSGALVGACVPVDLRGLTIGPVVLEEHATVGCGAVILPGARLGRGAAVGAMTIVKHSIEPLAVVVGPSARTIKYRSAELLDKLDAELRRRMSELVRVDCT
jgi:dTDP-4-amino-4,6-dideoxy-D-glucose acyltransferase